jgi:hypothetical protein
VSTAVAEKFQNNFILYTKENKMEISIKDKETLRALASRYMTYALSDKNNEKRELWRKLNDMNMQKPMISIEQMPWRELDVDGSLVCTVENPYFRGIEGALRRYIYKWSICLPIWYSIPTYHYLVR